MLKGGRTARLVLGGGSHPTYSTSKRPLSRARSLPTLSQPLLGTDCVISDPKREGKGKSNARRFESCKVFSAIHPRRSNPQRLGLLNNFAVSAQSHHSLLIERRFNLTLESTSRWVRPASGRGRPYRISRTSTSQPGPSTVPSATRRKSPRRTVNTVVSNMTVQHQPSLRQAR